MARIKDFTCRATINNTNNLHIFSSDFSDRSSIKLTRGSPYSGPHGFRIYNRNLGKDRLFLRSYTRPTVLRHPSLYRLDY